LQEKNVEKKAFLH